MGTDVKNNSSKQAIKSKQKRSKTSRGEGQTQTSNQKIEKKVDKSVKSSDKPKRQKQKGIKSAPATSNVAATANANSAEGESASLQTKQRRDFSSDLIVYLADWAQRLTPNSTWKFNKNLQNWTIDNLFDIERINEKLFSDAVPYISSIQGNVRDRLKSTCQKLLSDGDIAVESESGETKGENKDLIRKRALLISSTL